MGYRSQKRAWHGANAMSAFDQRNTTTLGICQVVCEITACVTKLPGLTYGGRSISFRR
jgi:hypothetical protein